MRPRFQAIANDTVALNVQFLKNGVAVEPYAVRSVRIYKQSVRDENLVTTVVFPDPTTTNTDGENVYDNMLRRIRDPKVPDIGQCGTDLSDVFLPGAFILDLFLPIQDFKTGIYFDEWCFIGDEPTGTDFDIDDEDNWTCTCNKFFVRDAGWYVDDNLSSVRIGFEALDARFVQPECRTLEVGMMPLPLYDFDVNKMSQLIPSVNATITIETQRYELLVDKAPMIIGLREGSYRTNPYVLRYLLDTSKFLKGTYRYRVDLQLPNGETRSSPYFWLSIR